MKYLLIGIVGLLLTGCAMTYYDVYENPYNRKGNKIKCDSCMNNGMVQYFPYEYLMKEVKEKVAAQMMSDSEAQIEYSKVPEGGELILNPWGFTLAYADPENSIFIIKDSTGTKEYLRQKGNSFTPRVSVVYGITQWTGTDIIFFRDKSKMPPFPFIVYMVSTIDNKRSKFKVYNVPFK